MILKNNLVSFVLLCLFSVGYNLVRCLIAGCRLEHKLFLVVPSNDV